MKKIATVALAITCVAFACKPGFVAADQSSSEVQKWQDQDSWQRFSEREEHHTFKLSHPVKPKPAEAAPSGVAVRLMGTHVVQDGPSKPSGNYYSQSTADPTASGNYYATPPGLPKAAPIIQQEATPRNYWGKNGNPLPSDMQP